MQRAKELATAHWGYVNELLHAHGVDVDTRNAIGKQYRIGMIAGYEGVKCNILCFTVDYTEDLQRLLRFHFRTAWLHGAKHREEDDGNMA